MKLLRLFSSNKKKNFDERITDKIIKFNNKVIDLKIAALKKSGLDKTKAGKYFVKEYEVDKDLQEKINKSASRFRQNVFLGKKGFLDATLDQQNDMLHLHANKHDRSYKNMMNVIKNEEKDETI